MTIETQSARSLCGTTVETILYWNSSALLAAEMKEIRLQRSFHYICHYLFLDLFSEMNI